MSPCSHRALGRLRTRPRQPQPRQTWRKRPIRYRRLRIPNIAQPPRAASSEKGIEYREIRHRAHPRAANAIPGNLRKRILPIYTVGTFHAYNEGLSPGYIFWRPILKVAADRLNGRIAVSDPLPNMQHDTSQAITRSYPTDAKQPDSQNHYLDQTHSAAIPSTCSSWEGWARNARDLTICSPHTAHSNGDIQTSDSSLSNQARQTWHHTEQWANAASTMSCSPDRYLTPSNRRTTATPISSAPPTLAKRASGWC